MSVPAQDQQYENFIIRYKQNIQGVPEYQPDETFQIINDLFGVLYVPMREIPELQLNSYSYSSIPRCYTYMDTGALSASGVTRLHGHPYLKLKGSGTLVAIIDSGIDYLHPAFHRGMTSKILSIWDQELDGGMTEKIPFGREFTRVEIEQALSAENPWEVVPSMDKSGHGTGVAATAAGYSIEKEGFSGAAPEAELVIVKLKQAKRYLRDFYLLPQDADIYQEDDIMLAIAYVLRVAAENQKPLSICIGLGSSMGAHQGEGPLNEYINSIAAFSQNAVSVSAGNEGTARHHYMKTLTAVNMRDTIELRVGEKESTRGFMLEFWGDSPNFYSMMIQSPAGEQLSVSTSLKNSTQELSFVFVETKVLVNYVPIERRTGNTLIFIRFLHPAAGIWKFLVEGRIPGESRFHIWLPVRGMISDDTYFLEPSPEYTITSPGDAADAMTATAYQYRDNSLYVQASRGYNTENVVKPDFAAPGVDILTASNRAGAEFVPETGTSLAAAQTAGMAALLFEWSLIRENEPYFTGNSIKNYLSRGAVRDLNLSYPNQEWGYGEDVIIRLQSNKASKINGFRTFFLSRNQTFLLGF